MPKSVFTDRYRLFCQILVQARIDTGVTQSELAERLSKPQSYVSKFERGERRLDVVEFLDIADALGLDVQDVLERLREPHSDTERA